MKYQIQIRPGANLKFHTTLLSKSLDLTPSAAEDVITNCAFVNLNDFEYNIYMSRLARNSVAQEVVVTQHAPSYEHTFNLPLVFRQSHRSDGSDITHEDFLEAIGKKLDHPNLPRFVGLPEFTMEEEG
jgi:hypothetical protein